MAFPPNHSLVHFEILKRVGDWPAFRGRSLSNVRATPYPLRSQQLSSDRTLTRSCRPKLLTSCSRCGTRYSTCNARCPAVALRGAWASVRKKVTLYHVETFLAPRSASVDEFKTTRGEHRPRPVSVLTRDHLFASRWIPSRG